MKNYIVLSCLVMAVIFPGCSSRKNKEAVKVMTMNIRYDNPEDSANAWPNRIGLFCRLMAEARPDLIGMQEVLWSQYALIDSVLTDYGSVGVGRDDGARGGEMNPVFYRKDRFDLVRTLTFWLSETPEVPGSKGWGASLPRIVTWIELADRNTHNHFYLFNTHFAHDSDSARIMSSKILLAEVEKLSDGFPFVITGDFNTLPYSTAYAILTGPSESVPLIKDSYFISEKKPTGPTYTFNGFSNKESSGRFDYIFVKSGIEVLEHETFVEKSDNVYISDHWPVMAKIILK